MKMPEETDVEYVNSKNDEGTVTGDQQNNTGTPERIEERQNQVYLLRLRGHSNKEIAEKLQVSLSTVEKDMHEIKENTVRAYKRFREAGVYESFQDACGQIELVLQELWKLYNQEKDTAGKLKILSSIKDCAKHKLEYFETTPKSSVLLNQLKQQEENEQSMQKLRKALGHDN